MFGFEQQLWLYDNYVRELRHGMVLGLNSLEELWFGRNQFTEIKNDTFLQLESLLFLQLSENEIESIDDNFFINLRSLQVLWLHDNEITELRAEMFKGLESLRVLTIHSNGLTTVPASAFSDLPRPLELGLKLNPTLQCDSRLCWLKDEESAGTITWFSREADLFNPEETIYSPNCPDLEGWDTWVCPRPGRTLGLLTLRQNTAKDLIADDVSVNSIEIFVPSG